MSPIAGLLVDKYGGRWIMTLGSLVAGVALMSFSVVDSRTDLFFAILVAEGAGMCVLYNVAFAAVSRLKNPVRTARSISIITLFGGVASTIFWPLTLVLYNLLDWRETWLVLGAMVIFICVPIHFLVLSGPQQNPETLPKKAQADWPPIEGKARKHGMFWMVISFTFSGYLMGALMMLWVTNVQDLGHTAAMAAFAGAVIGPFKTVGRALEMVINRNMYPLATYLLAMALALSGLVAVLAIGASTIGILIGAALYGMGDGIKTIARGTLPLALFGPKGYGVRLGWISALSMAVNASAPFVFAWITQTHGGWVSFATMTFILSLAILTYFLIPDPRRNSSVAA